MLNVFGAYRCSVSLPRLQQHLCEWSAVIKDRVVFLFASRSILEAQSFSEEERFHSGQ